jgi:hypothetical protein
MILPSLDRAVLGRALAQIAQSMGTHDSKTDQTAQTDQRVDTADKFATLLGSELTSRPKLTSGTAQKTDSGTTSAHHPSSRALQVAAERPLP